MFTPNLQPSVDISCFQLIPGHITIAINNSWSLWPERSVHYNTGMTLLQSPILRMCWAPVFGAPLWFIAMMLDLWQNQAHLHLADMWNHACGMKLLTSTVYSHLHTSLREKWLSWCARSSCAEVRTKGYLVTRCWLHKVLSTAQSTCMDHHGRGWHQSLSVWVMHLARVLTAPIPKWRQREIGNLSTLGSILNSRCPLPNQSTVDLLMQAAVTLTKTPPLPCLSKAQVDEGRIHVLPWIVLQLSSNFGWPSSWR